MCFQLYAGTSGQLPRSNWNRNDPHVHVSDLKESDSWTGLIFSKPKVQYIGSTSGCGCDFPSVMKDRTGDWPYYLDPVKDADVIASDQQVCEELCRLLSSVDDDDIELYGVWAGNEGQAPLIREEIVLDDIRREYFRFKEGGFYRVKLR